MTSGSATRPVADEPSRSSHARARAGARGRQDHRPRARAHRDEHLPRAGGACADAGRPDAGNQRDQHGVDADRGVPRVRHAGRVRDARSRLRAIARVDQHPRRGHRRHLHLRRHVLGVGLRVHVRAGQRLHRHHGFFLQGLADTYGTTGVPLLAFWVFQFAFADTCSTITSGAMVGRCGFVGDILYSIGVTGLHLSDHRPLGLGTGRLAGGHEPLPFRDFAGSTVVHTIGGAISLAGAIALGPAARPRLPARRRRAHAAAQHHPRRRRRPDPLVRLVRLQPGQHAVGAGPPGHRPRLVQHDAGGLLGGSGGAVLRLRAHRQVGSRAHRQRLPGRAGGHHLPVLLGQPDRRVLHRHRRRARHDLGHRRARVPAHRRSDWRGAGAHGRAASGARCRSASSRPASTGCRRRWAWTRARR